MNVQDSAAEAVLITAGFGALTRVEDAVTEFEARVRAAPAEHLSDGFWPASDSWRAEFRPYVVVDGVLQIPVRGVLLNDFPYAYGGWATGYAYIARAIERGVSDPGVERIALIVNSPGGIVTDCFETADAIFAARAAKPIVAYVADSGYSAAYALASAAKEIVVSRTGGVGSVGVLTHHVDASGAYEQMGLVKTYLFAGKHKVDGNETEPLSKSARSRIEARLGVIYDVFTSTVARNRGMVEADVRATEALTYSAGAAIAVGFADRIGTYADAVSAAETGDEPMDEDQEEQDMAQAQADNQQTVAAAGELASAIKDAVTEAVASERGRISAILGSDAAKTRPVAAHQAAFVLNLSADAAAAFLAAMPEEKAAVSAAPVEPAGAAAPAGMFAAAMDASGGAGLSAGVTAQEMSLEDLRKSDPNAYIEALRSRA